MSNYHDWCITFQFITFIKSSDQSCAPQIINISIPLFPLVFLIFPFYAYPAAICLDIYVLINQKLVLKVWNYKHSIFYNAWEITKKISLTNLFFVWILLIQRYWNVKMHKTFEKDIKQLEANLCRCFISCLYMDVFIIEYQTITRGRPKPGHGYQTLNVMALFLCLLTCAEGWLLKFVELLTICTV